ncbi:MAG: hypothetical protein M3396_08015 [Actinomycetota bacterium]|nr:hypothetical protein [Actinomycetota bacterium]MDQ3575718.1 hypothetical protein [Actinomycetota bacterium]
MIDVGLLTTIAAMLGMSWLVSRRLPLRTFPGADLVSEVMPALGAGVLVGRLTAMALDDPGGLTRLGDIMIIRGGVEFWPGVAAGIPVLAWYARREGVDIVARLADVAPFALWAYATYEGMCLVRGGCFGPPSPIGLEAKGTATSLFPVGLAVALVALELGVVVLALGAQRPALAVMAAIGGLGAIRSVAAIWLPRVDAGLSRPHKESIAVTAAAAVGASVVLCRRLVRRRRTHYDVASE